MVLALASVLLTPALALATPLPLDEAIRAAWTHNEGYAASARATDAARLDADAARDRRLPTLSLSAQGVRTDEPVAAFGMRLDQARITAADFAPERLNHPDAIGGYRLGATITQVLYGGGRVTAGARAAAAQAAAAAGDHQRRRDELALGVVEAYFGSQVAAEAIQHAGDVLAHALETERFVRARVRDGAALESELARATAFRAQAEAELAAARRQLASSRSALELLAGSVAADAELTTPIEAGGAEPPLPRSAGERVGVRGDSIARPDLAAAHARSDAAREASTVARGSLLPEVFAQASAETMRSGDLQHGASWTTLALGIRWQLGVPDTRALSAARARQDAAESAARWQERQASREVEEARRAIDAADAQVRSASEAVVSSESARAIREARHRQGLLPLTEVLDAEAGLAGSRALLLGSRYEARVARAQLQLALGQPIEGVNP